ncbi:MAG: hypothetical protein VYE22_36365 [Myxococcota bacterium]|nr:hypothetical protein [Myxococcota bacterium]
MTIRRPHLAPRELSLFRALFVTAALWNLAGGIIGYLNPALAFELLFDRALTDPLYTAIYRGACGTTLVYFIGYLVVAYDPVKHTGIVLVGGIGKIGFALNLLQLHLAGIANASAYVVIVGDAFFFALFLYYFARLFLTRQRPLGEGRGGAAHPSSA